MIGAWGLGVAVAAFAATLVLTGSLRRWLAARELLDHPVARSSHKVPVPRGGGLVVVPVVLVAWLLIPNAPHGTVAIVALAAALAALSWLDDIGGLSVRLRLGAHAIAVIVGLATLPVGLVFQGVLPPLLDRAATALLWLWFVELYNFMDGIDGITGVETGAIGIGIALMLALAGANDGTAALALATAAAAFAFLIWNWHPARIFLGDVGSVPLGFLVGWLLLGLAARGLWAPALILPLYYLADATITLLRRSARGATVWEAHREHYYQRALAGNGDHATVARMIAIANGVLVALAVLSRTAPAIAVVLAACVVVILLARLERRAANG